MQRAIEYAFLSARDAAAVGIPLEALGNPAEVGFVYVEDSETCERFTRVGDAETVRKLQEAGESGDVAVPGGSLPIQKDGWPDEWQLGGD